MVYVRGYRTEHVGGTRLCGSCRSQTISLVEEVQTYTEKTCSEQGNGGSRRKQGLPARMLEVLRAPIVLAMSGVYFRDTERLVLCAAYSRTPALCGIENKSRCSHPGSQVRRRQAGNDVDRRTRDGLERVDPCQHFIAETPDLRGGAAGTSLTPSPKPKTAPAGTKYVMTTSFQAQSKHLLPFMNKTSRFTPCCGEGAGIAVFRPEECSLASDNRSRAVPTPREFERGDEKHVFSRRWGAAYGEQLPPRCRYLANLVKGDTTTFEIFELRSLA